MSSKIEKPTLTGARIKTRKRDEKEKFDPFGFRDAIIQGLNEAGTDLEAVSKFLDTAGSKLDYRRYGEALFDTLIAGGCLAPGGSIVQDAQPGKPYKTELCVFGANEAVDSIRKYEQVLVKLIRRYKYLEKMLEEEMKKVLVFLKGFSESERIKLARFTALLIANGTTPATILASLTNEHLVKDGLAVEFLAEVFNVWKAEKGSQNLTTSLKKAGLDQILPDFFPPNKRSEEYYASFFTEKGLKEIVKFQKAQQSHSLKRELQKVLEEDIQEEKSAKDIAGTLRETIEKHALQGHEVIPLIFNTIMSAVEWNKKEELVASQALQHLKQWAPVFQEFTGESPKAELSLLIRIQEYCFENIAFMKAFQKIILLLYKTDVISEEVILKWYKESHSQKGKSVFLEQMKKFVDWLQNAETESESGEDEE
ncbi:protein krasavietz-like [Artemia franciscana]|uniref:W2 domain-containing protein n=2 Tax=Artemia franciscana TaxID=6661 RepID=A0AA88HFM9_ARTSF|nr:hypothetical protein QYM36_016930 [Artemia franciscana]